MFESRWVRQTTRSGDISISQSHTRLVMKRITVILMTIMVTSVTLSGCAGNEAQLEETIDSLEQQAIDDQERMSTLNTTVSTLEVNLASKDAIIAESDSLISGLEIQVSSLESDKSALVANISSLESDKSALVANIDSLKADLVTAYSEGYAAGSAGSSAISTRGQIISHIWSQGIPSLSSSLV